MQRDHAILMPIGGGKAGTARLTVNESLECPAHDAAIGSGSAPREHCAEYKKGYNRDQD
jgi:hypothetical protein